MSTSPHAHLKMRIKTKFRLSVECLAITGGRVLSQVEGRLLGEVLSYLFIHIITVFVIRLLIRNYYSLVHHSLSLIITFFVITLLLHHQYHM